ncbi:MAG: methyltransferase domain-containing protein [Acidithiobacillus sp.]
MFFQRGLDDNEVGMLYSGYRDSHYNDQRLRVEPSYINYIQMFENKFSDYWVGRTNELLNICRKLKLMHSRKIIDFGGDGMIPSRIIPGARVVVDDVSIDGGDSALMNLDVIFASEVFEHLSYPLETLISLRGRLNHRGHILIDVPLEYSGSIRQAWEYQGINGGGSLMTMHEHINHFSIESLEELFRYARFDILSIEITPLNFIVAVATPSPSESLHPIPLREYLRQFTLLRMAYRSVKRLL